MDEQRGTAWIAFMALYVGAFTGVAARAGIRDDRPAYRQAGQAEQVSALMCRGHAGKSRTMREKGLHETEIQKAEIRKAGIRKIVGIAEKIVH